MIKLKVSIIIVLAIISFGFVFIGGDIINLFKSTNFTSFIYSHIGYISEDNYIGIIFDYIISIAFNINIKDFSSYFKIFGG